MLDTHSVKEIAKAWVYPAGAAGLFGELRDRHRERVLAEFAADVRDAGVGGEDPVTRIKQAVVAEPDLLVRLPGDAGIAFAAEVEYADMESVRRGLDILAVELAARSGDAFECQVGPSELLLLPLSGLALPVAPDAPVTLVAAGHALAVIDGEGQRALVVGDDGQLTPTDDTTTSYQRDVIEGITIDHHWDLLSAPVERFPDPTVVEPPPLGAEHRTTLRRAFRLLDQVDSPFAEELREYPTRYVPLRNQPGFTRHSVSIRQLPGVLWANMTDPFEVLDLVIHEFSHNKMCLLEDDGPLMARPAVQTPAPWRRDLRTAQGLFHGIYVFYEIARVFDMVFQRWEASERGLTRVALLRVCIEDGLRLQQECDPGLNPLASTIMDLVAGDNVEALEKLETSNPDRLSWARRTVREHLTQVGRPDSEGPWFLA